MVKEVTVEGVKEFEDTIKNFTKNDSVFVLFTGSLGQDGKSWCPDCIVADPVIMSSKQFIPANATFIVCHVGERAYWKDSSNAFKTRLGITCVPTLLNWNKGHRLQESECADIELLKMLYEED
jgi:thiol-disulfide isomerase/thioredoxin